MDNTMTLQKLKIISDKLNSIPGTVIDFKEALDILHADGWTTEQIVDQQALHVPGIMVGEPDVQAMIFFTIGMANATRFKNNPQLRKKR